VCVCVSEWRACGVEGEKEKHRAREEGPGRVRVRDESRSVFVVV
jgi:hypothetical protein